MEGARSGAAMVVRSLLRVIGHRLQYFLSITLSTSIYPFVVVVFAFHRSARVTLPHICTFGQLFNYNCVVGHPTTISVLSSCLHPSVLYLQACLASSCSCTPGSAMFHPPGIAPLIYGITYGPPEFMHDHPRRRTGLAYGWVS